MTSFFHSFARALLSQLHFRMLLLTVLPFVLAVAIWGVALWFGLQPMIDWLQAFFSDYDLFRTAGDWLGEVGLGALKAVMVPLLAMWALLPLMILTALLLVGALAMPAIASHVGGRHYPQLEKRRGGSAWGGLWVSLSSFVAFAFAWTLTLPLNFIPPFTFFVQPLLLGWLTCRVMTYDALAEHADADELRILMARHRWPLLGIGMVTGSLGAAPSLVWLGGIVSVILFPLLAGFSIWLYVLVFVFTGLWFQHYCLDALERLRSAPAGPLALDRANTIDIN